MTVCADDVPHRPDHIRRWYDQELLSLANRSFCIVLANQRLVAAKTDEVHESYSRRTIIMVC